MLKNTEYNDTPENNFGVKSVEDSALVTSRIDSIKRSSVSSTSPVGLKDGTNYFRMIVCGDSGIGKSALVQTLTTIPASPLTGSLEPNENFIPFTDICVVDTCGYGASVRPEMIFSNTKKYLEKQFEKTNGLFHPSCRDDQRLVYMLEQTPAILTHVNVCLYIIAGRLKAVDIEYMRYMHEYVNIVPVIIQPDVSVRMDQMTEQRLEILHILAQNQIKYCTFGYSQDEVIGYCKRSSSFFIPFILNWSSTKPLFHGLTYLKQALFDTHLNHLRTETIQKFLQWRQKQALTMSNVSISTSLSGNLSTSSSANSLTSAEKQKASEYVSQRRRQLEKELLKKEKELKQEYERLLMEKKRKYLAIGLVDTQDSQLYYNRIVFAAVFLLCLCVILVFSQYSNKKDCLPP